MSKPAFKFGLTKSRMERYLRCGASYDYHYNKKIRPIKMGSALVFGIAIDAALNELILKTKVKPMDVYRDSVKQTELGKMSVSKYDYDRNIIDDARRLKALNFAKDNGYRGDDIDELFRDLFDVETPNKKQAKLLDYLARVSLECKAEIILASYKKQIIPKIKKVHSVQKNTKSGILDLVVDWETLGNKVIADNKTSSSTYEEHATDYSVQLTMYAIEEKINKIMFIVIPKRIETKFTKVCTLCGHKATGTHRKCDNMVAPKDTTAETPSARCNGEWDVKAKHKVTISIIEGNVNDQMKERTTEIVAGVGAMIESKTFVCNFANCGNQFGKPCEYRELYWKGDMTGLEDQSKKDKK